MSPPSQEEGSATVINLVLIVCLIAVGLALSGATVHVSTKSHANGVADLAALAAAHTGACESAAEVLARNPRHNLRLTRCEMNGAYAQVHVHRAGPFAISATARAGPAW